MEKAKKTSLVVAGLSVLAAGFLAFQAYDYVSAQNCAPGTCPGAISALQVSGGYNVGIGTSTPANNARLFVYSTTSDVYAISASGTIYIATGTLRFADGTSQSTAFMGATSMTAANISAGAFGSNTGGGNYIFPGRVGIGTGTSTLAESLEVVGKIRVGTTNTISGENITFDGTTSPGMRVVNSSGYISITPLNTSWAHIYTDRANFIFNQPVYSITGKFSAYNTANLELQTQGTTRILVATSTGNVGIGTTGPATLTHLYKATGDSILTLENTGNGNSSGINFTRERLTGGAGNIGGSVFMDSDTSGNNALLYIQSQSLSAGSGVTSALTASNGVRLLLRGGTGIFSIENGASESLRILADGSVGIATTTPGSKLTVAGEIYSTTGGVKFPDGTIQTTALSTNAAPIFVNTIYGSTGDLPFRTTATTATTMRLVYGPFVYAMPACSAGQTKRHKLYAEYVDNITNTGQLPMVRLAFTGASGVNLDFTLSSTWGGSASYRNWLSSFVTISNSDHANIQTWINGTAGPYVEIRKLEIWTYCT